MCFAVRRIQISMPVKFVHALYYGLLKLEKGHQLQLSILWVTEWKEIIFYVKTDSCNSALGNCMKEEDI